MSYRVERVDVAPEMGYFTCASESCLLHFSIEGTITEAMLVHLILIHQTNIANQCKVCIKSPCTFISASSAVLAVHGLLKQTLADLSELICSTLYIFPSYNCVTLLKGVSIREPFYINIAKLTKTSRQKTSRHGV